MPERQIRFRQWASNESWEEHRQEISDLYRRKTLKDVSEYMKRVHDFHATERMYKFRLKRWGVKKNLAHSLIMETLKRLEDGPPAQGDPVPRLDPQVTQVQKLARYLKRNPETLQQLYETHGAAVQTLSRMMESKRVAQICVQRRLLPSKLRAPMQFELPDEIFRLLGAFLTSTPEESAIGMPRPPEEDELMLHFVLKFRLAHKLIAENHHRPGFLCLSMCFEQLSAVLASQRTTLLYVLNAALEVATDFALPQILALLFRYLHGLAEIQLGPAHPATQIARRFGSLERAQHTTILGLVRRLQVDSRGSRLATEVAFGVYDTSVELWSDGGEDLVGGLRRLLSESEAARRSHMMTLWLRMRVAIAMLDQGQFSSVEEVLRADYPSLLLQLQEPKVVSLIVQCYKIRGHMWAEVGAHENAEAVFRKGALIADAAWGERNKVSVGFADDTRKVMLLRSRGKAAVMPET